MINLPRLFDPYKDNDPLYAKTPPVQTDPGGFNMDLPIPNAPPPAAPELAGRQYGDFKVDYVAPPHIQNILDQRATKMEAKNAINALTTSNKTISEAKDAEIAEVAGAALTKFEPYISQMDFAQYQRLQQEIRNQLASKPRTPDYKVRPVDLTQAIATALQMVLNPRYAAQAAAVPFQANQQAADEAYKREMEKYGSDYEAWKAQLSQLSGMADDELTKQRLIDETGRKDWEGRLDLAKTQMAAEEGDRTKRGQEYSRAVDDYDKTPTLANFEALNKARQAIGMAPLPPEEHKNALARKYVGDQSSAQKEYAALARQYTQDGVLSAEEAKELDAAADGIEGRYKPLGSDVKVQRLKPYDTLAKQRFDAHLAEVKRRFDNWDLKFNADLNMAFERLRQADERIDLARQMFSLGEGRLALSDFGTGLDYLKYIQGLEEERTNAAAGVDAELEKELGPKVRQLKGEVAYAQSQAQQWRSVAQSATEKSKKDEAETSAKGWDREVASLQSKIRAMESELSAPPSGTPMFNQGQTSYGKAGSPKPFGAGDIPSVLGLPGRPPLPGRLQTPPNAPAPTPAPAPKKEKPKPRPTGKKKPGKVVDKGEGYVVREAR